MNKQQSSKILRHEKAKEKYMEFQSSRAQQMHKGQSLKALRIPQPGQFFLLPSVQSPQSVAEPSLARIRPQSSNFSTKKFSQRKNLQLSTEQQDQQNPTLGAAVTRSIKMIVNKHSNRLLSPTSKVIPQLIDQQIMKFKTDKQEDSNSQVSQHSRGVHTAKSSLAHVPHIPRPISAQLFNKIQKLDVQTIDNCEILQNAYDFDRKLTEKYDRKPTTFMVKRSKRIKHIQGYNTVVVKREDIDKHLEPEAKPGFQSPYLMTFELPKDQKGDKKEGVLSTPSFLPLEYYLLDDLSPDELLKRYRNPQGPTIGYSKWFDNKGGFQWRQCQVVGYQEQSQRWVINWLKGSTMAKLVSRSNLRFKGEDIKTFQNRLAQAENYRNASEIYYKYNYMIDLLKTPTGDLPRNCKQKIIKLVQGYTCRIMRTRNPVEFNKLTFEQQFNRMFGELTLISPIQQIKSPRSKDFTIKLIKQVENLYVRTNHQIQFNSTLPFSQQRRMIFYEYLPKELFESVMETSAAETERKGCLPVIQGETEFKKKERMFPFLQTFSKIQQNSHVGNAKRLKVMQLLRQREIQMQTIIGWAQIKQPCKLSDLAQKWQEKIQFILHQIYVKSCDTQHQIGTQLDHVYLERKTDDDSKKLLIQASKFLFLINHRFELLARSIFQQTLIAITRKLQKAIQQIKSGSNEIISKDIINYHKKSDFVSIDPRELLIDVQYKLDNNQLILEPRPQTIQQLFLENKRTLLEKMTSIHCIDKSYLEAPRSNKRMKLFDENDPILLKLRTEYTDTVNQMFSIHEIYRLQVQAKVKEIMEYNIESKKKALRKGNYSQFQQELRKLQCYLQQVDELMLPRKMRLGILYLDCDEVRKKIKQRIYEISGEVYKLLIDRIKKENQKVTKAIDTIIDRLKKQPTDVESMMQQLNYAQTTANVELQAVCDKINQVMQKMDLLSEMNYRMEYQDFQKSWQIYSKPLRVKHKQSKCIRLIQTHYKKMFSEDLTKTHDQLVAEIQDLNYKFDKYSIYNKITEVDIASLKMSKLHQRIENAQRRAQVINMRQNLLQWKPSDFSELNNIKALFMPYYQVWTLAKQFNCRVPGLMTGPFSSIDKKLISDEVENAYQDLTRLEKNDFKTNSKMLKLTLQVKQLYGDFKQYLPLINGLRNPDLRQRHWNRIAETICMSLNESYDGTLQNLIKSGVMSKIDDITEISDIASKELGYEKMLNKLKRQWREVKLNVGTVDNDVPVIENLDALLEKIDNDIVKVQVIIASPFIKFLEHEVVSWRNSVLYKAQQIFDLLTRTQQLWLSIYPIFLNKDIDKELPKESVKHQNFDKMWRALGQQLLWQPMVIELIQTKIKQNLLYMIEILEQICKGLTQLFDAKRDIFARFYFLSNDEMLTIYSQAQSFDHMRISAKLCFDAVDDLIIEDNKVKGIISQQQTMQLVNHIQLNDERSVEQHFQKIDKAISQSLKTYLESSLINSIPSDIKQLAGLYNSIKWTQSVSRAITEFSLSSLIISYTSKIEELSNLIRTQRQVPHLQSTLCMLLLQDLHFKCIIESLFAQQVNQITSFTWLMQMRFSLLHREVNIKVMNSLRKYGFEYVGARERACITPQTDRCFRALVGCLDWGQVGVLRGPQDSGKTETVAELAAVYGKRFIVLNCSEMVDKVVITKVFQGMCSSAAWVCFEKFDSSSLQILSVMAQLIKSIQNNQVSSNKMIASNKNLGVSGSIGRMRSVVIQDRTCLVDPNYGLFFTSIQHHNPRIPDTLRAHIRPINIVNPDPGVIISCLLISHGFKSSLELSTKILRVLSNCRELLLQNLHYDFGLKTAIQVVKFAATDKTFEELQDQYKRVYDAMTKVLFGGLIELHRSIFNTVLNDEFPEDCRPEQPKTAREDPRFLQLFESDGLELTAQVRRDFKLVHQTIKNFLATIVIGECVTGKSTLIEKVSQMEEVQLMNIVPKAAPKETLFGKVVGDQAFQVGLLSKIMKYSNTNQRIWVVFDGGIDNSWVQNLSPVLQLNRPLTLSSGEKLIIQSNTKLIFQTDKLHHSSPSFVSRCGKVYIQTSITWENLMQRWISKAPAILAAEIPFYKELVKYLLVPMISFVSASLKSSTEPTFINASDVNMMASFLRMFESLRLSKKDKQDENDNTKAKQPNTDLTDNLKSEIFGMFIFAVVWSFGSLMSSNSRKIFSKEFKHLCKRTVQLNLRCINKLAIPSDESSLFQAVFEGKQWLSWTSKEDHLTSANIHNSPQYTVLTTGQTLKNQYLLKLLLEHGHSMLLVGHASSGKNTSIEHFFANISKQKYIKTLSSFSSQTTIEDALCIFQRRIEKQRRTKNVVGPLFGKTNIIYINDISMAAKDRFGDQPALQLLRQWFTYGGWYDAKTLNFRKVEDIVFSASCSHAQNLPPRLLRYLNPICSSEDDEDRPKPALRRFVTTCLGQNAGAHVQGLMRITFNLHKIVMKEFKPSPKQEHMKFSFKEVLQVLYNISCLDSQYLSGAGDIKLKLLRAWVYQCKSVYIDRFTDPILLTKLYYTMNNVLLEEYNIRYKEIVEGEPKRLFSQLNPKGSYTEITQQQLQNFVSTRMKELNVNIPLLFTEQVSLLSKITKTITKPNGYALCISLPGFGIVPAVEFCAMNMHYNFHSLKTKKYEDWKEILKSVIKESHQKETVLLVQAESTSELILSQINSFMKIGSFQTNFTIDEIEMMLIDVRVTFSQIQVYDVWDEVMAAARRNLRIVVAINPANPDYKFYIRNHCGFFDRTTVIYVQPLLEQTISEIANFFIKDKVKTTPIITSVIQLVKQQLNFEILPFHVSEFCSAFEQIQQQREEALELSKRQLTGAVERVSSVDNEMQEFQRNLVRLTEEKEQKSLELDEITKIVEDHNRVKCDIENHLKQKEAQLNQKENAAFEIRRQCQIKLSEQSMAVNLTKEELRALDQKDLANLVKFVKSPNVGVKMTLEMLAMLVDKKRKQKQDEPWKEMLKQFAQSNKVLKKLLQMEPTAMSDKTYDKLKVNYEKHAKQLILSEKQPKALKILSQLSHSMFRYMQVYKSIQPARAKLTEANKLFQAARPDCIEGSKKLAEQMAKLKDLTILFKAKNSEKEKLSETLENLQAKIEMAKQVKEKFNEDVQNWKRQIEIIERDITENVGYSIYAASSCTFLSAFDYQTRQRFRNVHLKNLLEDAQIKPPTNFTLSQNLHDLPSDHIVAQNAIIFKKCKKICILVDPQGHVLRWLTSIHTQEQLIVVYEQSGFPTQQFEGVTVLFESSTYLRPSYQQYLQSHPSSFVVTSAPLDLDPSFLPLCQFTNFISSRKTIKDYFISLISSQQEPSSEDETRRILTENCEMRRELEGYSTQIIGILAAVSSFGDIKKEKFQRMMECRNKVNELQSRIKQSKYVEDRINKTRVNYQHSALLTSDLYCKAQKLLKLNSLNQFSLQFLSRILKKAIKQAQKPIQKNAKARAQMIDRSIKKNLLACVAMGLSDRDVRIWYLMVCASILEVQGKFDENVWNWLVEKKFKGGIVDKDFRITEDGLKVFNQLSNEIKGFIGISEQVRVSSLKWSRYFSVLSPQHLPAPPEPFHEISDLHTLLLLKLARPQLFPSALAYLCHKLCDLPQQPNPFQLLLSLSSPSHPCMVFESATQSSLQSLTRLTPSYSVDAHVVIATSHNFNQIQEKLEELSKVGGWLVVQGAEHYPQLMEKLELRLLEGLAKKVIQQDFRMVLLVRGGTVGSWMLHRAVKMTVKTDLGVKQNVIESYKRRFNQKQDKRMYNTSPGQTDWKRMFLCLSVLHSIIKSRLNYTPFSWSQTFSLESQDLDMSFRLAKHLLDNYTSDSPSLAPLLQTLKDCIYGCRVRSEADFGAVVRLIDQQITLQDGVACQILNSCFETVEATVNAVKEIKMDEEGMIAIGKQAVQRRNIKIGFQITDSFKIIRGQTQKYDIISEIPRVKAYLMAFLDIDQASILEKYPIQPDKAFNIFLQLQVGRFKILAQAIITTLESVENYVKCYSPLSNETDRIIEMMEQGQVPHQWLLKSYYSGRSLPEYLKDLEEKLNNLQTMIEKGGLPIYDVGKMFHPESLIISMKQVFCRKNLVDFDDIKVSATVFQQEVGTQPRILDEGLLISGLYLHQCSWMNNHVVSGNAQCKYSTALPPFVLRVQFLLDPTSRQGTQSTIQTVPQHSFPIYREWQLGSGISPHLPNLLTRISLPHELQSRQLRLAAVSCDNCLNI